jgi:hypothetical protein
MLFCRIREGKSTYGETCFEFSVLEALPSSCITASRFALAAAMDFVA